MVKFPRRKKKYPEGLSAWVEEVLTRPILFETAYCKVVFCGRHTPTLWLGPLVRITYMASFWPCYYCTGGEEIYQY